MPYQSHGYTVEDAIARSEVIYEVDFSEWGGYDPALPFAMPQVGMQYPPPGQRGLPASLAGVSIGPRSEVDRCWLSWDRQKPLNRPNAEAVTAGFISPSRIVTADAPLWFPQRGRLGQIDSAAQSIEEALQMGLLYAFPFASADSEDGSLDADTRAGGTTVAPTTWLDQFGAVQTESSTTGITGNNAIPRLQLILHLRSLTSLVPTKRAPLVKTGAYLNPAGTKKILAIAPIFGRKHVSVQAVSSVFGGPGATAPTNFYVGLIRGTHRTQSLATGPVFEVNAGTALAAAVNVPVSFTLSNPAADWVVLWGDSGMVASQGGFTIVAND
jgi:hypothetical protein